MSSVSTPFIERPIATSLLAAAIRQARSTDGPRLREALEALREKVDGLVMTYQQPYSKTDHETIDSPRVLVIGEIRNGLEAVPAFHPSAMGD